MVSRDGEFQKRDASAASLTPARALALCSGSTCRLRFRGTAANAGLGTKMTVLYSPHFFGHTNLLKIIVHNMAMLSSMSRRKGRNGPLKHQPTNQPTKKHNSFTALTPLHCEIIIPRFKQTEYGHTNENETTRTILYKMEGEKRRIFFSQGERVYSGLEASLPFLCTEENCFDFLNYFPSLKGKMYSINCFNQKINR